MIKQGTLYLAGGGNQQDSYVLDRDFVAHLPEPTLLYIPLAKMERNTYAGAYNWLRSVMEPLGIDSIDMLSTPESLCSAKLEHYGGVYLGGGNTFHLLSLCKRSGFDRALKDYLHHGGVVYGGSAGGIVLGKDILTCAHLDTNDEQITEFAGFDLLSGHGVWCHYIPEDIPRIEHYVQSKNIPVIALSEKSGLRIDNAVCVVGTEGVEVFYPGVQRPQRKTVLPGETFTF